jgi:hypothetical protein
MEADWEVEIGGDAPVIQVRWSGFIDLRLSPERAPQLPEAAQLPALADTLIRLNASSSPVWTSKCDVWHPDTFDPDELDAPPGERNCFVACYIDLLPRDHQPWPGHLDLIVRRACIAPGPLDLGVTAYFTACGLTPAAAATALASALAAFVDSL